MHVQLKPLLPILNAVALAGMTMFNLHRLWYVMKNIFLFTQSLNYLSSALQKKNCF